MDSSYDNPARMQGVSHWFHTEHGLEAIEFALIGALMTVLLVAALPLLSGGIYSVFETVMDVINSAAPPGG